MYEAEGRMGYWLRGHDGERNNYFSKIQIVGQKNIETSDLSQVKASIVFYRQNITNMAGAFRY